MNDGKFCPETEHAPVTPEGHVVAAALDRWGLWKRAGMSGAIAGIDMSEAMQMIPPCCDREFARRLFVVAESAFCGAAIRVSETSAGSGKE
jgi:hypothetical protein